MYECHMQTCLLIIVFNSYFSETQMNTTLEKKNQKGKFDMSFVRLINVIPILSREFEFISKQL